MTSKDRPDEHSQLDNATEELRIHMLENMARRYADLGERITSLAAAMQQCMPSNEATRIFLEDLSDRFERVEATLLLILAKINGDRRVKRARRELEEQERESLKRRLTAHYENLSALEEQKANFGLQVPIHLDAEIRNIKRRAVRIERLLNESNEF